MSQLRPAGATVTRLNRNRDFQKLWAAQSISVFGSQISVLAIPLTAAIILKVEPFALAMLGTIEVPAVHPVHAAGRCLGRSPPSPADPDLRRPRPGARALDDPARLPPRQPHHLAAVRGRLRHGHADRVLRRRGPELPAGDRGARPARRGQRQAMVDNINQTRNRQAIRPPRMLGRMAATMWFVV